MFVPNVSNKFNKILLFTQEEFITLFTPLKAESSLISLCDTLLLTVFDANVLDRIRVPKVFVLVIVTHEREEHLLSDTLHNNKVNVIILAYS